MRCRITPVSFAIIKKKKKMTKHRDDEDVERRAPQRTVGGDVNWRGRHAKQCGGASKNWDENRHVAQQSHCQAFIQKEKRKRGLKEMPAPPCSPWHDPQRPRHGNKLNVTNGRPGEENTVHTHTGCPSTSRRRRSCRWGRQGRTRRTLRPAT